MAYLMRNYQATERGRTHRQVDFSQRLHPCRPEALPGQLHVHSVPQHSGLFVVGHLTERAHTVYTCAPQMEQLRSGVPQDPGFSFVISVLIRVSSTEQTCNVWSEQKLVASYDFPLPTVLTPSQKTQAASYIFPQESRMHAAAVLV